MKKNKFVNGNMLIKLCFFHFSIEHAFDEIKRMVTVIMQKIDVIQNLKYIIYLLSFLIKYAHSCDNIVYLFVKIFTPHSFSRFHK